MGGGPEGSGAAQWTAHTPAVSRLRAARHAHWKTVKVTPGEVTHSAPSVIMRCRTQGQRLSRGTSRASPHHPCPPSSQNGHTALA